MTINTPRVAIDAARLAVDRARARGTLDHDARRAHAIDDPRRDRGRRDARDDVEDDAPIVGDHE